MEVWIVFAGSCNLLTDCTEWSICGVFHSEEKAKETVSVFEKEQQNEYNSLSDWEKMNEWEEVLYRMEKHSVQ